MIDPRTICEQAGVRFIAENHGTATFADPQSGETLTLYTFACDAENVRLTLKNALILFDPEPRRLRPYLFLAGSGASCSSFEPPPPPHIAPGSVLLGILSSICIRLTYPDWVTSF